jgi:hypothetical protein
MKRIAALLFISGILFTACATTRWVRTPVLKQKNFIVTLEQRQEKGTIVDSQYTHPADIETAVLEKVMQDLSYSEKTGLLGKEETNPVFQAIEIQRLAPVLADALAKADSTQRIRFTSHNRAKSLIFYVSRKTEGVIFIKPGNRLNMAFNYINREIDPNTVNAIPPGSYKTDPLKIRTADTPLSLTDSYAVLHPLGSNKTSPMWIIADLDKLDEIIRKESAPPVVKKEKASPEGPSTVAPATTQTPIKPSDDTLQADIKSKLKYLKELRDEGLISEDDYNEKKTELLDKIK